MRYNLLILDTYHPDTSLYIHEQGCKVPYLFFKTRRGPQAKKSEKHWSGLYPLYTYGANAEYVFKEVFLLTNSSHL